MTQAISSVRRAPLFQSEQKIFHRLYLSKLALRVLGESLNQEESKADENPLTYKKIEWWFSKRRDHSSERDSIDFPTRCYFLGLGLKTNQLHEKAIIAFERVISHFHKRSIDSDPRLIQAHFECGLSHYYLEEQNQAIHHLKAIAWKGSKIDAAWGSEMADIYYKTGDMLLKIKEPIWALSAFRTALKTNDCHQVKNAKEISNTLFQMGICYDQLAKYDKAALSYKDAIAIEEKMQPINKSTIAMYYLHLGLASGKLGQLEEMNRCYEKVAESNFLKD
jgi:tetratricopeptide (TPR) repeat protein